MKKKKWAQLLISLPIAALAGCSGAGQPAATPAPAPAGNTAKAPEPAKAQDPVKLPVLLINIQFTDNEFKTLLEEPLKKKFPHVTLEPVRIGGSVTVDSLMNAGSFPDLILSTPFRAVPTLKPLGVLENLDELIKKNKTDLTRFEPEIIDTIKAYGDKGEMLTFPYTMMYAATYYNKSIFDKFGVEYPKDMMTWTEAIELGRKIARTSDGVSYRGLYATATPMATALSLPYADPAKLTSLIDASGWTKPFQLFEQMVKVPNYAVGGKAPNNDTFLKEQSVAMRAEYSDAIQGRLQDLETAGTPMNWDMVTVPQYEEAKGKSYRITFTNFSIYSKSKNKDLAFDIINYLASDEMQRMANKKGQLTVLKKSNEFKSEFASELSTFKGKNKEAIFKAAPAGIHKPVTIYDADLRTFIDNQIQNDIIAGKDLNTSVRGMKEEGDKKIKAMAPK